MYEAIQIKQIVKILSYKSILFAFNREAITHAILICLLCMYPQSIEQIELCIKLKNTYGTRPFTSPLSMKPSPVPQLSVTLSSFIGGIPLCHHCLCGGYLPCRYPHRHRSYQHRIVRGIVIRGIVVCGIIVDTTVLCTTIIYGIIVCTAICLFVSHPHSKCVYSSFICSSSRRNHFSRFNLWTSPSYTGRCAPRVAPNIPC